MHVIEKVSRWFSIKDGGKKIHGLFLLSVVMFCVFLPLRDNYFKPIMSLMFVIATGSILLDRNRLLSILKDETFYVVLGFFLLLFVFGVLLTGDFYNNQKYFFYFYIAYLGSFVVGKICAGGEKERWLIYLALFVSAIIPSLKALFDGIHTGNFCFLNGGMGYYNLLGMFVGAILSGILTQLIIDNKMLEVKFWLGILLLFFALVCSFSRGAWVGFGVVVLLLGIRIFFRWRNFKKVLPVFIGGILVMLGIYTGLYLASEKGRDRIERLQQFNLSGREKIWMETLSKIREKPLGWGIQKIQDYDAHNQFLNVALGSGIITAWYFVGMMLWILYVFRDRLYSFSGMVVLFLLIHNLVEASLLGIWNIPCLFWFCLGLLTSEVIDPDEKGHI